MHSHCGLWKPKASHWQGSAVLASPISPPLLPALPTPSSSKKGAPHPWASWERRREWGGGAWPRGKQPPALLHGLMRKSGDPTFHGTSTCSVQGERHLRLLVGQGSSTQAQPRHQTAKLWVGSGIQGWFLSHPCRQRGCRRSRPCPLSFAAPPLPEEPAFAPKVLASQPEARSGLARKLL